MSSNKQLIQKYYEYFNAGDLNQFMDLLHEDVAHDINQGDREVGKPKFLRFMQRMNQCYSEQIKNIVIMTSEDASHVAAEFIVEGTYLATDAGLPPAHGQTYQLAGGAFFEIKDHKIIRITNCYNLNDWLKQIKH